MVTDSEVQRLHKLSDGDKDMFLAMLALRYPLVGEEYLVEIVENFDLV
jgi:hypothetical protein